MEERTILLVTCEDRIALEKRPETGLLASLYQFPNLEGRMTREEAEAWLRQKGCEDIRLQPAGEARHIFSHVEWHMTGYRAEPPGCPRAIWRRGFRKSGKNIRSPTRFWRIQSS